MLSATFQQFTDWFIPASLRTDAANLGKARIFVFSHIFGPTLGQAISVYLYSADPARGLPFWTIALIIAAFWTLPFLLKYTGHLRWLALASVELLTFVTLFGSYHYGGVSSPFLPWLLTALLLGFFYLGEKPAWRYGMLSVFGTNLLAFYGAFFFTGSFPRHVPLEDLSSVGIISVFSATVYMSMMALYYSNVVAEQSGLKREVRSHRNTEIKLLKAKEQAEAANQQKSEFLAKMSHELRTPLNAVIGYSEILLEDAEAEGRDEQIADLQRINRAGMHLLSLVTDILDLSKIETGDMELASEPFSLASFVDDVVAACRPLITEKANKLVVERSDDLGVAVGDATKLRQAALNLLSNASKFTENGRITLVVTRETIGSDDWIKIAVRDSGIGIKQENLAKLFQDFNQAEVSTASRYGGTGLGLVISQLLCRMMGGEITVESEYGKGSCFTINVPAILLARARPISSFGALPPKAQELVLSAS